MHRPFTTAFVLVVLLAASGRRPDAIGIAQLGFVDDFEHGLEHWEPSAPARIRTIASGDPAHGQVLLLEPDGDDVYALIKGTERSAGARLEGDVRFPTSDSNLLGVIYNFQRSGDRADFGAVYIKGNDSYLQANPQHDFNVSRTLYPEFHVPLTGSAAIVTGMWQHFKVEVVGSICHFYVGDMTTPRMTFPFFEGKRGSLGLHPRSVGGPVWVDNVRWAPLTALSYSGPAAPAVSYARETMLTEWTVAGPFTRVNDAIAREPAGHGEWRPLAADPRGAVLTAAVTDFHGERTVAYLRARVTSAAERAAILHFSTADDLALWVNGRFAWFVQRDGAAWYDFATNPKHAGQKIPVDLVKGANDIVIRVRGGAYATGGFFAKLEEAGSTARQTSSDGEQQIIALERARQNAFVRGDIDFLDRQTADIYTTINGAGALSTKPEMMRSLRAGTIKVKSFELAELSARIYGEVAALTGVYRDESSVNGRDRHVDVRFTRVFVNEHGIWRAVSYQQTPIQAP